MGKKPCAIKIIDLKQMAEILSRFELEEVNIEEILKREFYIGRMVSKSEESYCVGPTHGGFTKIDGRKCFLMVMPLMDIGDVFDQIYNQDLLKKIDGEIDWTTPQIYQKTYTYYIMKQVLQALMHLHDLGIVYRDLKLENIMLSRDGRVYLADFGLSCFADENDAYRNLGSVFYVSPDQLGREGEGKAITTAADIWTFGIICWELMSGDFPYKPNANTVQGGDATSQVVHAIYGFSKRNAAYQNYKKEDLNGIQDFILRFLLCSNPEERLSAKNISLHLPFRFVGMTLEEAQAILAPHFSGQGAAASTSSS